VIDAELRDQEEDEIFFVHEDNWLTVLAFCALSTQWLRHQIQDGEEIYWQWQGITYSSIPTALEVVGVARRDRRIAMLGITLMERAALKVLNARGEEGDG
jgi:hypothetical protein